MTFGNRHSFIGDFVCAALFISGSCALGGCTEMTETQDIGGAGGTAPLTIRVTAGGFAAAGEDNSAPDTRTPTEDGFTTKFNNGDAIGIFAIRGIGTAGGTLIDGTNNLKLVYTTAADGTPYWAPASGDTHVLYSYDETLTYVAYYPYRDGITINPAGTADEITGALADNTALQPATDQSSPAAYTGSDLMTAVATPAADPANANKKVLTLAFAHQYALLVLKPRGLTKCVAPTGGGFEYKDAALGWAVDIDASDAVINGTKALRMADGTFRTILKTTAADAVTPTGSYKAKGGKTVLYTGAALAAGKLVAGKYYTQQSDVPLLLGRNEERALQIGDYFARDGKILSRETPDIANPTDYVGIVLKTAEGSDARRRQLREQHDTRSRHFRLGRGVL